MMSPIYECPACGRKLRWGEQISPPKRCPYCGTLLEAGPWKGEPERVEGAEGVPAGAEPEAGEELAVEGEALPAEEEEAAPVSEPHAPPGLGTGSFVLCAWLTAASFAAGVLAVASGVAYLLAGQVGSALRGPAVGLGLSVGLGLLAVVLAQRRPLGPLGRKAVALAGMAVCAAMLLDGAVRLVVVLWRGLPRFHVPGEAALYVFLAFVGAVIFWESLRGMRWACRCVAVSACVLVAIMAVGLTVGAGPRLLSSLVPTGLALPQVVALAAVGALALAGGGTLVHGVFSGSGERRRLLPSIVLLALMACAAGYAAWQGAAQHMVPLSFGCLAAGIAPVLIGGVIAAWVSRGSPQEDLAQCVRFGWLLCVPGALALLVVWLPAALRREPLEAWCVGAGAFCIVLAAWFGRQRRPWFARWALVPAVILGVLLVSALDPLRARFSASGLASARFLGGTAVVILWSVLVATITFAAAGLAATARRVPLPSGVRTDSNIFHTCGWMCSGLLLVVCYVARAGRPELAQGLRESLAALGAALSEIAHVVAGPGPAQALRIVLTKVGGAVFGGGWVTFVGVAAALCVVLAVHVASGARRRWAGYLVLLLWGIVTALGALVALALAGRLFWSPPVEDMGTPLGRLLAGHLSARLLLLALLLALLWRFVDGLRTMYADVSAGPGLQPAREPAAPAARRATRFSELNAFGMLACVAGLVLALMLGVSVSSEAVFFHVGRYWAALSYGFVFVAARVGLRAAEWSGVAFSAGVVMLMLLALHEETRGGRVGAYPWVAALWTGILAWLATLLMSEFRSATSYWPARPGERFALIAVGFVWLVLAITTVALWWHWWSLKRRQRRVTQSDKDSGVRRQVSGSARSLGSVGLCVSLTLGVVILYSALGTYSGCRHLLLRMESGLTSGTASAAFFVDGLRTVLEGSNLLRIGAIALMALSACLLVVHYISQFGFRWAAAVATGLWGALSLLAIFLLGRLVNLSTAGQWDVGELLLVLVAVAAIAGMLLATFKSLVALLSTHHVEEGA